MIPNRIRFTLPIRAAFASRTVSLTRENITPNEPPPQKPTTPGSVTPDHARGKGFGFSSKGADETGFISFTKIKLSTRAKHENTAKLTKRYKAASNKDKGRLLAEMYAITG